MPAIRAVRQGRSVGSLRTPGPDRRRSGDRSPAYNGLERYEYISVSEEVRPFVARMVEVGDANDGQRLDNFLTQYLKGVPKSHLYKMIRSGEVRLNKGRTNPDARVHCGDLVRLPPVRVAAQVTASQTAAPLELPILFEDDDLLALDKPAGLAVHGGSGIAHGVIERLRAARPQAKFLELVHRLDRGTSGVLLIAKRRPALVGLHGQLREGQTDKRYRALVAGRWPLRSKRLQWPLLRTLTASGERMVYVSNDGQSASTVITGLRHGMHAELGPVSLIEAKLETGRTHQIRVHCAHAGFPIVGDDRYGDFAVNDRFARAGWRRMFLHAHQISFAHPVKQVPMALQAQQPAIFEALLAALISG